MKLLNWDESISVGVKEIDDQHKKIFDIINRLYENMEEGIVSEKLSNILRELTDYSHYHFSTEEKYFDQFNYPDKENHVKIHQIYKEKINQLIKISPDSEMSTSFEMLDFLEDWWFKHINGLDKQYTKFFNEHGLS